MPFQIPCFEIEGTEDSSDTFYDACDTLPSDS